MDWDFNLAWNELAEMIMKGLGVPPEAFRAERRNYALLSFQRLWRCHRWHSGQIQ